MKVVISLLAPFCLIMFLSSCARIIYIGKRVEPEIILENKHNDIVFVNLFDYTTPENVKQKASVGYQAGVTGLVEGLSSFSSDSSFSFLIGDTLRRGIKTGFLTTLLPEDTISDICDRYHCNLLLALDSLSIFFDLEINVDDDNEGINRTKNFYLNTRFFLSLYSSTGDLINRSEVEQSSLYRSRPTLYGFITIEPSLAKARVAVGNQSFQAGEDYVDKFFPKFFQETKQLYTGKLFRESNQYVFAKNWNKAIELLEQLAKNQDTVIVNKARYNMDIVKEAAEADKK
jgi:hypothetical protein